MAQDTQTDPATHRQGLLVSGAMHVALLAVLAFGFTQAPPFTDATESIPVETITSTQLNEIMQGEKDARPAPEASKPAPPEAAPLPPPRPEPPKEAEPPPPEPPKEAEPPPPEPPKRPEPPKPEPPKPAPPKPAPPPPEPPRRPEPPKPQAAEAPSPPQRPRPEKAEETPRPPERPRPVKTEEPPKPSFKPDDIAKALAKEKAEAKLESKPESMPESKPKPKTAFDPSAISKLIGQTRTAELSPKPAVQGLPNHQAARMSVNLENGLNEWFRDSYKNCWTLPPSNPTGENYVFDVRVTFNSDGSLSGRPVLLNPPHDPEWRTHADSVMRAVMRCNPLRVPAQYAPFFDQWRSKTIHFDPSSAEG